VTTYCYDPRDRVKRVVDGAGNKRDTGYTTSDDVSSLTDANSAVFSLAYTANHVLSKLTQPAESGRTAAATSFDYGGSSGAGFLPTSTVDPQGNCTGFHYDPCGNMTDSYAGNTPSAANECNSATTGVHNHLSYNEDGTVSSFDDGRGKRTTYSYTNGNPTRVAQPGSGCTTPRKLCTDLTYDGLNRVATATDGNNTTTTYTYDELDRITKVFFGGATACNTGNTNCVKYTYDAEGNLRTRVDATGTTTYSYDLLNRPKTKDAPAVATVTTTFDGAGNLTDYSDGGGAVSYGYTNADQLASITDPNGTVSYAYGTTAGSNNDVGRVKTVTYPGGTVTVTYGYTKSGKIKSITPSGITGQGGFSYKYEAGTQDLDVMSSATDTVTYTYTYDTLNRLATATAAGATDYGYGYDATGNMTSYDLNGTRSFTQTFTDANQMCWRSPAARPTPAPPHPRARSRSATTAPGT
jgi:YD repeat-containing protein